MRDEYDIRPMRPDDGPAILASFNVVFREVCGPHFVDRDAATWRWLYEDNPAGARVHVAATAGGEIAALYAALPNRAITPVGETVFAQIVDSYTHPAHRQGLKRPGLFILTALPALERWERELGDGMFYGYPVRAAERMGQRYLNYRRVRVIDYLVRDVGAEPAGAPAAIETRTVANGWPDDLDALAARFAAEKGCLIARDRRYLDWRYARCTAKCYQLVEARRAGELVGLMVLRRAHELLAGACGIADWIVPGPDPDVGAALLAHAEREARAADRRLLLAVFAEWSPEHALLRAHGFALEPSANTLLRPLTYRINHPALTPEMLHDAWWYTLGDSDLV